MRCGCISDNAAARKQIVSQASVFRGDKRSMVLFVDPRSASGIFPSLSSILFAPRSAGYRGAKNLDLVLELGHGYNGLGLEGWSDSVAKACITDSEIFGANDPYWNITARQVISSLVRIAGMLRVLKVFPHLGSKDESITQSAAAMLRDISTTMAGSPTVRKNERPQWWDKAAVMDTDAINVITQSTYFNADRTAGCIASIVFSALSQIHNGPDPYCQRPCLQDCSRVLADVSCLTVPELRLLLAVSEQWRKSEGLCLFMTDVSEWPAMHRSCVIEWLRDHDCEFMWSSQGVVPAPLMDMTNDIWWGATQNGSVLRAFSATVARTTREQFESLPGLSRECPADLQRGEWLVLANGRWSVEEPVLLAEEGMIIETENDPQSLSAPFAPLLAMDSDLVEAILDQDFEDDDDEYEA